MNGSAARTLSMTERIAALRRLLSEVPPVPDYNPTSDALKRARELGEKEVAAALNRFLSMPQSTTTLANPSLYQVTVEADGAEIGLGIRSYSIRGVVQEDEIVRGEVGPYALIFVGLFGRRPGEAGEAEAALGEEGVACELVERSFFRALGLGRPGGLVRRVAERVHADPGSDPAAYVQYFMAAARLERRARRLPDRGINDERSRGGLLVEMIATHMRNVAVGALAMQANRLLRDRPGLGAEELAAAVERFVGAEREDGKSAFEIVYSCILGRPANPTENRILERMGMIQMHHGSAGSNMVARYLVTLHAGSVLDLFAASLLALDAARHFGAIHDMTAFIRRLEETPEEERTELIREEVLKGGLPTFGHPEIAAAGRGSLQQDPRAAIYLAPVFEALDRGELELTERQRRRLALMQLIYRVALVEGVIKPGREEEGPLRLTPNTDFGAWSVQEALGIPDSGRTFLTYVFRGFGWMMDAREQLQQKIVRPVIAPDPRIMPRPDERRTIPTVVTRLHERMAGDRPAFESRT
ncbi:MAG TPA: citrate/2-methylcitrate synthase [Thermoanaerobaculia bacterium]|nr:citrate/2-methylcitrate synthase [Thermoanaerobaculia bacterium]